MTRHFNERVNRQWSETRARVIELLQRDAELRDVASVVGPEALEDKDRLVLAAAAAMREFVLGQSAFDPVDAFSPPDKTFALADAAIRAVDAATDALSRGIGFPDLPLGTVRRALAMLRDAPPAESETAHRRLEEALAQISLAEAGHVDTSGGHA